MKEADMLELICPWLSGFGSIINCKGSKCTAFASRPTYVFLAKDGKSETTAWQETLKLTDLSQTANPRTGAVDQIDEINRHVANGWNRQGIGSGVHLTKPGEPNCWCDAMAGNAQCGYEAP